MRIGIPSVMSIVFAALASPALGQNWSFDARDIALSGVDGTGNLATGMVGERRNYRAIVLPFGFTQIFEDTNIYKPDSKDFDPIRAVENASSPLHYVVGRNTKNSAESLFVSDMRNATLSRDLTTYKGFVPANDLLAEGLLAPKGGHTFKFTSDARGGFQGVYVGASPYISLHADGTIDPGFTTVLATGVNVANARFPLTNNDQVQVGLAIIGGYRGRFPWPAGVGAGSPRDGLYVAVNYNYLRGFAFENDAMAIGLNTDAAGLISNNSNINIIHQHATKGTGLALDLGVQAVVDRWEVGFGAYGAANRLDWTSVEQTMYTLDSLTSGNSDFRKSTTIAAADTRVKLPVDYRGQVKYYADEWSVAAGAGHGFGGGSFHGGVERRFNRVEVRGGARYTFGKWNPSAGVGFDLSPRVSLDVAAFGTNTNIERKRHTAVAASIRFNH